MTTRRQRRKPLNGAASESIQTTIPAPRLVTVVFSIRGVAPYVQHKFSAKARGIIKETQEAGSQARSKRRREPKDFEAVFQGAQHKSAEGWIGIPATAFRNAMIDACRLVGFKMTIAKLSVFVEPDGLDVDDGAPLVRILGGPPERHEGCVRNATGVVDIRVRPMWREWGCNLRVTFDEDQFSVKDVSNLLARAGYQVGVGEGRPNSKASYGQGWGLFRIEEPS
jgi:hypothetical protein